MKIGVLRVGDGPLRSATRLFVMDEERMEAAEIKNVRSYSVQGAYLGLTTMTIELVIDKTTVEQLEGPPC